MEHMNIHTNPHHSTNPRSIIIDNHLGDCEPGDFTLAIEVQVTAELLIDVLHHLRENCLSIRHLLVNLLHPVIVIFLLLNLPCSEPSRRTAHLLETKPTTNISRQLRSCQITLWLPI